MNNAPVTNKAPDIMNLSKSMKPAKKGNGSDSFSQVLDKTKQEGVKKNPYEPKEDHAVRSNTQLENSGRKVLKKQQAAEVKTDVDEVPQEALDEAQQKIAEAIAKQLGITVEEVMSALQDLKLTPMDLLNKENLASLLTQLGSEGDMLSLLTDETMYEAFTKLTEVVETTIGELKEAFSLTDEEFTALLEENRKMAGLETGNQIGALSPEQELQQLDGMTKEIPSGSDTEKAPMKEALPSEKGNTVPKGENAEKVITVEVEGKNTAKETQTAAKSEAQSNGQADQPLKELGGQGQGTAGEQNAGEEGQAKQQVDQPLYQTVANRLNNVQQMAPEAQVLQQTADTESIMKQIMDYMKIQVKADMTQMEIQLHPSSLGNINVQISSKEGVISAQFTAQNETVKAALETQIIQLKEQFNEQGLKVEAVEVTVASHQFERQMEQENQGNSEAADHKKKGIRRINLEELAGSGDAELEEADKLTADMMQRNGNSVDYMA